MFGGCTKSFLFASIDTFRRGAVIASTALTHLDEHERTLLLHDDVDFAERAAVVAREEFQSGSLEVFARLTLCRRAVVPLAKKTRDAILYFGSSMRRGVPLRNRAHASWRCRRPSRSIVRPLVTPA